jgi:hypothetical protein
LQEGGLKRTKAKLEIILLRTCLDFEKTAPCRCTLRIDLFDDRSLPSLSVQRSQRHAGQSALPKRPIALLGAFYNVSRAQRLQLAATQEFQVFTEMDSCLGKQSVQRRYDVLDFYPPRCQHRTKCILIIETMFKALPFRGISPLTALVPPLDIKPSHHQVDLLRTDSVAGHAKAATDVKDYSATQLGE